MATPVIPEVFIRRAKDAGLTNLHDLNQNKIWCAIVALAYKITAWMQTLALTDHLARRWEPKRRRLRLLWIDGALGHHSRVKTLHLLPPPGRPGDPGTGTTTNPHRRRDGPQRIAAGPTRSDRSTAPPGAWTRRHRTTAAPPSYPYATIRIHRG